MLPSSQTIFIQTIKWMNDNQGLISVAIFAATLLFGWISGIFSALRRKPKFKISLQLGPTFCCTYFTGEKHGEYEVHRSAFALYLRISNIGSAASSIDNISLGYHWDVRPFSLNWLRYSVGWFWLHNQAIILSDFQVKIGENLKVYPFLIQRSYILPTDTNTYLDIGMSTNGVVYFEQSDSWGGCFPFARRGNVRIKVRVQDAYGRRHTKSFVIQNVSLDAAREYNPSFGETFAVLRGQTLP
jgi:hypothetical protein